VGVRSRALESLVLTPEFWRGRRVLVTGHTGFKGSWLCMWLGALQARVAGLALQPPTQPSLFDASGLGAELASRDARGDVRDAGAVERAFADHQPEVVFHMAAQSLVRESYRRPAETFATNVMGTVNCLEAARETPSLRALVVVTSDKCYRNRGGTAGYREGDPLGGDDPYSASKAAAELATHAYRQAFFSGQGALVASARAGNVIGGGDWAAERLVPDAARAFAAARPLAIRNPASTRPWQHVLEPLRGYLDLAERLHAAADVQPVSRVADGLAARWGAGARWQKEGSGTASSTLHEAAELALDAGKARAELGWRPALPLDSALDWVVDWYKQFAGGAKARALTLEQITRYQALCAR
jgi:CDP-glucose 4,6-dehydratase